MWPLIGINFDINYYSLTRCWDVHHCLYSGIQRLHRNRILLVRIFFRDSFYSTALCRALRSWWSPKTCHTILHNFMKIIIIEKKSLKYLNLTAFEAHFMPFITSSNSLFGGIYWFCAFYAFRVFDCDERHFESWFK